MIKTEAVVLFLLLWRNDKGMICYKIDRSTRAEKEKFGCNYNIPCV